MDQLAQHVHTILTRCEAEGELDHGRFFETSGVDAMLGSVESVRAQLHKDFLHMAGLLSDTACDERGVLNNPLPPWNHWKNFVALLVRFSQIN
jgi:hypothetical protein